MHMLRCTLTHNNINSGVKQTQVDPQYSVSLDFSFMHKEYSCPRPHQVTVWKSDVQAQNLAHLGKEAKCLAFCCLLYEFPIAAVANTTSLVV